MIAKQSIERTEATCPSCGYFMIFDAFMRIDDMPLKDVVALAEQNGYELVQTRMGWELKLMEVRVGMEV